MPIVETSSTRQSGLGDDHGEASKGEGDPDDMQGLVKSKITEASQLAGSVPGGVEGAIEKLNTPLYNWRTVLKSSLGGTSLSGRRSTYSRADRRKRGGKILFPGNTIWGGDSILILIDDSGSVTDYQLQQCMSEIDSIVRHKSTYYAMYDYEVHESISGMNPPYKYRRGDYKRINALGRGGTSVGNALEWVEKNCGAIWGTGSPWPNTVLIFTDGYDGSWPKEAPGEHTKFVVGIISATHDFPDTPDWAARVTIDIEEHE